MTNKLWMLLVIGLAVAACTAACTLDGQRRLSVEERETVRRTLEFPSGTGAKIVEVDNVQGSIRVTGYDGSNVELVANKTIRAASQDKVQTAKDEVKLDISERSSTINIYVDQPGHERSTQNSSRSNWSNRGYEVTFDFELRVPRQAEIHLWTVNDGNIEVKDIAGDFDVSNINGGIDMRGLSGSGEAHTVNGPVKVAFASNPKSDTSFKSINGEIEATFQRDLSADLHYKTFNGGVYTDFPITALPTAAGTAERRNGKFVYKSNDFSGARIGKGGPRLEFDGFNGDVRIVQAK